MREAGPVDENAVFRAIETEGILGEIVSIVARAAVRAVTSEPKPSRPISSTRRASSHRPSAVVLPFEILPFTLPVAEPALPQVRSNDRALPLHVVPLAEESLFSRLENLVSRLQVSFHTLASHSFGIDDRTGRTVWWHRPHPWTLAKISQCTGVKTTRLRSMTFEELQPVYRGDEDPARFLPPGGTTPGRPTGELSGSRFVDRAWRGTRFHICGPCGTSAGSPCADLWHGLTHPLRTVPLRNPRSAALRLRSILSDNLYPMWRKLARPMLSDGARSHPAGCAAQRQA